MGTTEAILEGNTCKKGQPPGGKTHLTQSPFWSFLLSFVVLWRKKRVSHVSIFGAGEKWKKRGGGSPTERLSSYRGEKDAGFGRKKGEGVGGF